MDSDSRKSTLETYGKSWSETDPSKRLKLFEQCLSPDCVYTDPNSQVTGYDQFSEYMTEFQKSVPGGAFVATNLNSHHDRSLMHWNMVDGKGDILSQGASFLLYGIDGRLQQMTGFFETT
ncbi:MAG: nuclear transport factor 2 family protein [Glaciimonas sp.]|nr:nuclear transport factor 2 family protein [Glaciimonas sp.]